MTINGDTQTIMDQEIDYAADAGLDYWAFLMYKNDDPMYYGISKYLSSSVRNKLKFCLIAIPDYFRDTTAYAQIKSLVQESGYLTVMNGRPVLYLYNTTRQTIVNSFGGNIQHFKNALDSFRTFCTGAGLQNPYIVIMDPNPNSGRAYTDSLGTDAISAYTTYGNANDSAGSYSQMVSATNGVEYFWNTCKSTGSQVVPTLMAGWDRRPRVENPVPWEPSQLPGVGINKYFVQPTPAQLTDHFRHGMNWLDSNQLYSQARLAIAYAWNENDEGGYLVPTLYDGTVRLDSLKLLLNPDTTGPAGGTRTSANLAPLSEDAGVKKDGSPELKVYASGNSGELVLAIQSPEATKAVVKLFDMGGRLYSTQNISLQKGQNIVRMNDSSLGAGIYMVNCKSPSFQLNQKFLK